jgi:hypothetical protein
VVVEGAVGAVGAACSDDEDPDPEPDPLPSLGHGWWPVPSACDGVVVVEEPESAAGIVWLEDDVAAAGVAGDDVSPEATETPPTISASAAREPARPARVFCLVSMVSFFL